MSDEVIRALDGRFGDPVDAYVNGSQTWLRDDGPGGETVEWRLHPVPNFVSPPDVAVHDLFATVALAAAGGSSGEARVGTQASDLWDGLEAFPAYGDELEPAPLAAAVTDALGLAPDGIGLVEHERIADDWERSERSSSITEALFAQLRE